MAERKGGYMSMGGTTHKIPLELFETNRQRLLDRLKSKTNKKFAVLLQGGEEIPFYDTDTTYVFKQESYFMWCFGVLEAGCFGVIESTGVTHLFVPRLPESYATWMGPLLSLADFSEIYNIPKVHYVDDIVTVLEQLNPDILLTLKGVNSDSKLTSHEATFPGIEKFQVDNQILFNEIANLRAIKTPMEIEVIKHAVDVSSAAHRLIMRYIKPGMMEYVCESKFLDHCYSVGGCRHVAYTCICGTGINSAVLHYGHAGAPNNKPIQPGDMCLFDMGGEYFGYSADITCSYPANGKFTADQKLIYEAVLASNLAVHGEAKPGVSWVDMHLLANRVLLAQLKKGGLLQGSICEMMKYGLNGIFQPHGLGHLMGLDVHDVGAYLPGLPERPTDPGLGSLRTARILEENMVLTVEPGCYFIEALLNKAFNDPKLQQFLVPDAINRFKNFGGVRIEDDILITANGALNLTKVPRSVDEIERWMAGKDDDKY